jgi:putative ABC transport system ATP-binding protein
VIRLEGVSRTYEVGDRPVHALVEIDETIAAGEHIAVMGASGSGKSTLLNIVGCLDRPTAGRYLLEGREVGGLDDPALTEIRRHRIGFIFQSFHLVPRLSAAENVELPMIFAGIARRERRERAAAALAAVGLEPRAGHLPDQLSGGERQRVAIARATVMHPAILLADEPTGNLDTRSGGEVLDLLDQLNEDGLTLIVVTHDPVVARRADRLLLLVDGRIVHRAPSSQVAEALAAVLAAPSAPGAEARR